MDSYDEGSSSDSNDVDFEFPSDEETENKNVTLSTRQKIDPSFSQKVEEFMSGKLSFNDYKDMVREKNKVARLRYVPPPEVRSLCGEANMSLARRDYDATLQYCKEALRHDHDYFETYRTLSELYEELGDHEKSLQLGIISAMIGPKDGQTWMYLAKKAEALNDKDTTIMCYTKAARYDRTLLEAHLMKICLHEQAGNRRRVIESYQKLLNDVSPEVGAPILEYGRNCAKYMHESSDVKGALQALETAFSKAPTFVTMDDVNLIVELYVALQSYEKALEVISKYCDIEIEAEDDLIADEISDEIRPSSFRVISCKINGEMPLQIRAKLVIILIQIKSFQIVDEILEPILKVAGQYADLIVDIAESFMSACRCDAAFKLLKLLVNNQANSSALQIWLLYAECLKSLGRKEEAVSAYLTVMNINPHLGDVRLVVSDLLNDLGREDEALNALTQDPTEDYLDVSLLFERSMLLKDNPARAEEFLAVGRLLMSRHCSRISVRKELKTFTRHTGYNRRQAALRKLREEDVKLEVEEPIYVEGKRMPTADDDWQIFVALCNCAFDLKKYALLQRLTFSALGSKVLCKNPVRENEVYIMATLSCFFNRDSYYGHTLLRTMLFSDCNNKAAWNLFNLVSTFSDESRAHKFAQRLLSKKPTHSILPIIFANNCFMAGSYKEALSEYLLLFKHNPTPLMALMIACTFMQLSSQKMATNKNALVTQAMGFICRYRALRGEKCLQETHYNLGRLNHHLGLFNVALYHYKQALETEPFSEEFDLKREAAYNIAHIYQSSKSFHLAQHYISNYIVV